MFSIRQPLLEVKGLRLQTVRIKIARAGCTPHLPHGRQHSHLDSAGYSVDEDNAKTGVVMTPKQVAEALFKEESWRRSCPA